MPDIFGPYFTERELGIREHTPDVFRTNLFMLVKLGLNPIRKKYGPVKITSGLRSLEHNTAIGGVNDSQHITGEAADIWIESKEKNRVVFEWLREWWPGQVLYYLKKGHIHIGLPNVRLAAAGRLYAMVLDK